MEVKIDIKAEGSTQHSPEQTAKKIRELLSGHFTLSYLRGQGIDLTALSVSVEPKG